jgi:hypothetical protein
MQESFSSYGITGLPSAAGGQFKFDADAWIEMRQEIEGQASNAEDITDT